MKQYEVKFSSYICERGVNNFMKCCDLMHNDMGVKGIITLNVNKKPTKAKINKMIEYLEKSKEAKELPHYFLGVEFLEMEENI